MNVTYQNGWAVPAGWKLVPEKPTDEWISALSDSGMRIGSLQSAIRDMLAAAPQPPQAHPLDELVALSEQAGMYEQDFAQPPQAQRKPLTESAIQQIGLAMPSQHHPGWLIEFARAIERAHGIGVKND